MSSSNNIYQTLVYPEWNSNNPITNILLIDRQVNDYNVFVNSVNSTTFPIVYSFASSKKELMALLKSKCTSITRIGICFASLPQEEMVVMKFLDKQPFFVYDEPVAPYSKNVEWLLSVIRGFHVKNIDFLACNTLNSPAFVNYYKLLTRETGVIVGASNNKTGNIKYGGDWVMENTSQDVELIYFSQKIEYYTYLLDSTYSSITSLGLVYKNFMYYPPDAWGGMAKIDLITGTQTNGWGSAIAGQVQGSYIYGDYMYVSSWGNTSTSQISKYDLNTGVGTVFIKGNGIYAPQQMVVVGNYMYVSNYGNLQISRLNFPSGTMDTANWATGITANSCWIYSDGVYIYYMSEYTYNCVNRINILTQAVTLAWFSCSSSGGIGGITFYNNNAYISCTGLGDYGQVVQVNLSTNVATVFVDNIHDPAGSAVYNGRLYLSFYSTPYGYGLQIYVLPTLTNILGFNAGTISTLSSNDWHNVVLSISGTIHSLYVDASLVAQNTSAGDVYSAIPTINNLYIGCAADLTNGFTGIIDEFKIYNSALSAADISANYTKNKPGAAAMISLGLLMAYSFDTTNDTYNSANALNDGTLYGRASVDTSVYRVGQSSLKLSGGATAGGGFNLGSLVLTSSTTITMWVYQNASDADYGYFFALSNVTNSNTAYMYFHNKLLTIGVRSSSAGEMIFTGQTIPFNVWTHVAVVSSANQTKMYVNGSSAGGGTYGASIPAGTYSKSLIGSYWQGATDSNLVANVDDFRVYNRVLTSAEITSIYNLQG